MSKYKIVMARSLMAEAQQKLSEICDIKLWDKDEPIPDTILADWLKDAEGLVAAGNIKVTEQLLSYAPKLKVIAQSAVGYDNIDVNACTKRGIPYGNTPGVLVDATADIAFGLLLCAARRIHEGWDFVRQDQWKPGKSLPFGIDLFGKTLGIVGMGQIGVAVAKRAQAFGMKVIYNNRNRRSDDQEIGARYVSFDGILEQADAIIVLTPLSPATRGLFGTEQFAAMKPTAIFVNAARGQIVDTNALVEALVSGKIAYAALDVTEPEPLPGDHPLVKLPNVLITPHIGSATTETRNRMSLLTVENLMAGLEGRPLPACVNNEVNSQR